MRVLSGFSNVRLSRLLIAPLAVVVGTGTLSVAAPPSSAATLPYTQVWARTTSQGFQESSPMAANLDGQNDVVVGGIDGNLYAMKGGDGGDVGGFPVQTGAGIDGTAAIGDVDGSGTQSIYIGSGTPGAHVGDMLSYTNTGALRWRFHPSDNDFSNLAMFSSPALGDTNGDGATDVSAFSLGLLGWSFTAGGVMNKGWPFYQDDTVFSSPPCWTPMMTARPNTLLAATRPRVVRSITVVVFFVPSRVTANCCGHIR